MLLTEKDKEYLELLSVQILQVLKLEKLTMTEAEILSKNPHRLMQKLRLGVPVNIVTLIRFAKATGYEITLVKKRDAKRVKDDPAAIALLYEHRIRNKKAKRKERGQPIEDQTRVKKYKAVNVEAYSRRKMVDEVEQKQSENEKLIG